MRHISLEIEAFEDVLQQIFLFELISISLERTSNIRQQTLC